MYIFFHSFGTKKKKYLLIKIVFLSHLSTTQKQDMMKIILFVCLVAFASIQAAEVSTSQQRKLTLRGRVVFPDVPRAIVDAQGKLIVELQDTSLADAPARVIARTVGKSIRFPMAFALKYSPKDIVDGFDYSLRVRIEDKNGKLLYTNDRRISVKPTGLTRTKLIDVPVIVVRGQDTGPKRQWPELVGKNGAEAVETIKKETGNSRFMCVCLFVFIFFLFLGFRNVVQIKQGSPVTMDFRTDRVRVFVNNQGKVAQAPVIA